MPGQQHTPYNSEVQQVGPVIPIVVIVRTVPVDMTVCGWGSEIYQKCCQTSEIASVYDCVEVSTMVPTIQIRVFCRTVPKLQLYRCDPSAWGYSVWLWGIEHPDITLKQPDMTLSNSSNRTSHGTCRGHNRTPIRWEKRNAAEYQGRATYGPDGMLLSRKALFGIRRLYDSP